MSVQATEAVAVACATVRRERLAGLLAEMVNVPSPTGEERPLAEHLAARLAAVGMHSEVQSVGDVDGTMANAFGIRTGSGGGRSLLLYAPIDTVLDGDLVTDLPWAGSELRADMRPHASRDGDVVIGLGAQNPKGHGACIVAAVEALAGIGLAGDLVAGFGAGGMPTNARRIGLPRGHGDGCAALLEVVSPDAAVIAKSGWAVSWEEVGLAWYELRVGGTHTYVGSRHLLPYRSAIGDAARVVIALESWFPEYAERHRDGLVAPQGVVSFVEAGWERMPAFTPAVCRLRVDLRLSPRTTPEQADAELDAELRRVAEETGADIAWERIVTIPGTTTDPRAPIIEVTERAWAAVEGRPHEPIAGLSGATDANILRARAIPTARVGLPKVSAELVGREVDFELGMNAVSLSDMERLTCLLIRTAVEWCS